MTLVPTPLREIAKVVRSKNAGPFEITLDIVFKSREDFDAVRKSGVITKELVSELYNVPTQNIITFGFFELVNAVELAHQFPGDHAALLHRVEVLARLEDDIKGDLERPGVLAAHHLGDLAQRRGNECHDHTCS